MTTADKPWLGQIQDVSFQPVFIMGDHRSGTTLLYDLLNRTGLFNIVTSYHVIEYDRLLKNHFEGKSEERMRMLDERFASLGIEDRSIDKTRVHAGMPEEYGFFLKHGRELNSRSLSGFDEGCRKIQLTSGTDKPLLLKNPWDYHRNFTRVRRYFPHAPFIFIHRHPAEVINSKLKAIQVSTMKREVDTYSNILLGYSGRREPLRRHLFRYIFSTRPALGAALIGRSTMRGCKHYLDHIGDLDQRGYCVAGYDELCSHPDRVIGDILAFLGMSLPAGLDISSDIAKRPVSLLPEVERYIGRNKPGFRAWCEHFGYAL